uniref:BPI2 domain-containing protein n=1 Tax=Strongyloides papillosus TaxID=174720 RepID=A0A0N5CBM7_STREA
MSENVSSYNDFLKNAIANSNSNVNNFLLFVKVAKDMNKGFEFSDSYSRLLRGKIKEITGELLYKLDKNREAYIYVNEIRVYVKYDFQLNEFHKELEVLSYRVADDHPFTPSKKLHVIKTKIDIGGDSSYEANEKEGDLERVYNDEKNLDFSLNVLVLLKGAMNETKVPNEFVFNLIVGDYLGNTMNCVFFKSDSSNSIYDSVEIGKYYNLSLSNAKTFLLKSSSRNFTTFDKGLALTFNSTKFLPASRKFQFPGIDVPLKDLECINDYEIDQQASVIGVVVKIDDISTYIYDGANVSTSRRIIYLTNGTTTVPIFLHGELAYCEFEVGMLVGVKYSIVRKHSAGGRILSCNRASCIVKDNLEEYKKVLTKVCDMDLDTIELPDVYTAPTVEEALSNGKFLIHIKGLPSFKIKPRKFLTMGRITFFGKFTISEKAKEYGPFAKVTIADSLVHISSITLFANRLSNLIQNLTGNFSTIIDNGTDGDVVLKNLLHIPMLFKIKISNYLGDGNNGEIIIRGNKIIEYVGVCPDGIYEQWTERMKRELSCFSLVQ